MDIKALIKNIKDSFKTTTSLFYAVKKVVWLYSNKTDTKIKRLIKFKYPLPVGNISLAVRDNFGADAFILSEVFQDECYYIALKKNTKNILDLGANVGFAAVYFSRQFPEATIACVEPIPSNIALLKENLSLNKVRSVVFEAAATTSDQEILMSVGDKDYAGKVQGIPFGKSFKEDNIKVDGLSIPSIVDRLGWKNIDLLKIDIEGYEGVLLSQKNKWLALVETIIMEIHEGVTADDIKELTVPYGFIHHTVYKNNLILSKQQLPA